MSRAARDRRVFYIEEPVFDVPEGQVTTYEQKDIAETLHVITPHVPSRLQGHQVESEAEVRNLVSRLVEAFQIHKPLLWFYTPMALPLASGIDACATVYDCMDELSAFQHAPPQLREREQALFAQASGVFTGGQSLYEAKRKQHHRVYGFASSVEREHFAQARKQSLADPFDQRQIAHPRVGYLGVIDERIDLQLLERLADAQPGWQLVMVGPVVKIDPASLPRRPNIHYLGQKTYGELPSYLGGWSVALMPFALNESTKFISPTKTLEYLAAGLPVVSTAVRDVVTPYGELGLVRIGDTNSFNQAVADALAEPRELRRADVDAYLSRTSWDQTWAGMNAILSELAEPVRARGPAMTMSNTPNPTRSEL